MGYFELKNKLATQSSGQGASTQSKSGYFSLKEKVSPLIEAANKRQKEEQRITNYENAQKETELRLKEFEKTQGGFLGTINRFIGKGTEMPTLIQETPEYTQKRLESKPKTFGQNVKNFFTEATTESIYDVFFQHKADTELLDVIKSNNNNINILAEKNQNETNQESKVRRQKLISDIYEQNKILAEKAGGGLKGKTNAQLVGQSLMTALELTPFLGLKEIGTLALKLGLKQAGEVVAKDTVKKIVGETAGFGATAGLAGGLQQKDATVGDIAKSTAIGGVVGGTLGFGLGKLGQFFAKKASQKLEIAAIKNIETKIGKMDADEIDLVREALKSGTDEETIVKELSDIRKSLDDIGTPVPKTEIPEKLPIEPTQEPPTLQKQAPETVSDKSEVQVPKEKKIAPEGEKLLVDDISEAKTSDYLLTSKEAIRREKEILSDMNAKERELSKMEKLTLDEEKFLSKERTSDFIFDDEVQYNYQSFKGLLRQFKTGKKREELLNGDTLSIKRVLGDKLKTEELDNILYSSEKSEDEMLDFFRKTYARDKAKITSDELVRRAKKRLESDPDYTKLKDELSGVKERKIALEKAESDTIESVNKELQSKKEVVEPKKEVVEPKKKVSVIGERLNKVLPEDFKIDETYDPKVIKEEIDRASQAIFKDKEGAVRKAFDSNTNPVERDAILIELSEIAKRDGDYSTVADLFQRRVELIRAGAQSLNMEKASILLNPEEKYMRDIVNSRLGSVKVNGKDITDAVLSETRKTVRKETSEVAKKAFKIQDAQDLFNSLICT